jgi:hypothetical protein
MSRTITYSETLAVETCCNCGIRFAMPVDFQQQRQEDHCWFYCPNQHGQHYTGKTDAQKLKERLEAKEQELARERARGDQARAEAEHERNRVRGYQGALGKAKKRAAKGVCPAPGCKRSFVDVARHVSTCHPDLAATEPVS